MLNHRNQKHLGNILFMLSHVHSGHCKPCLREFVVHKIPEIHSIRNSVGDEIKPEQESLVIFFRINDQRQQTQQNKKRIHIQDRGGIKRGSVICNIEII